MSKDVYTFVGAPAYSEFRAKDKARQAGVVTVHARYIHYVKVKKDLDVDEEELISRLLAQAELNYNSFIQATPQHKTFHVVPRSGTISPWSSKATNIATVCGLGNLAERIERGLEIVVQLRHGQTVDDLDKALFYDRMTEELITESSPDLELMFSAGVPEPLHTFDLRSQTESARDVLQKANRELGLALDSSEIDYLIESYSRLGRKPTDVELFMFAQVNSEHCRHKQFNASWTIDGADKAISLFNMIKNTEKVSPAGTISKYSDNAAVMEGYQGSHWAPRYSTGEWEQVSEHVHYLAKVETHNHPTAVSPFPGAATGSGGEIRDEGAVGRGSKPKAGLAGFSVSDLNIPGLPRPWENAVGKPHHIASALQIMLEAPIGSAAFNNEFGRPCLTGYFRTLTTTVPDDKGGEEIRGFHKPIMLAGGVGTVRPQHATKSAKPYQPGTSLLVLGGPAMLIGLGGGAASSQNSGVGSARLDFESVQRGNPEVQRRVQEVIDACRSMGAENPIKFIHDVGAGGLSNALPELIHDAGLGADFELRQIDNADRGMSPKEIWCCEAQERYVVAVPEEKMNIFRKIADRERSGYSVVGKATGSFESESNRLVLTDRENLTEEKPIDLPMSVLFGKPPRVHRVVESRSIALNAFDASLAIYLPRAPKQDVLCEAVNRVLSLPSVGSKSFLITIGDRTVGGLTARDQMVGPWQVPVADVAVTATSLTPGMKTGEAMAMGEKPVLALINAAASARMAVAESLMNLAAAHLPDQLQRVKLSANWMCASNHPGEGAKLYEAVEAIGMGLCPQLGIGIPVGKDSMSMKMGWTDNREKEMEVTAPLSLNITAFAPVADIKTTWTPQLRRYQAVGESTLYFVDLGKAHRAMGGTALAQVFGQVGNDAPDIRDVQLFKDFFDATQKMHEQDVVLAYHDRSDDGLFVTLAEVAFAGRCGIEIMLDSICPSPSQEDVIKTLFNGELGAVFQVRKSQEQQFKACFATCGPPQGLIHNIGRVSTKTSKQDIVIYTHGVEVYRSTRSELQKAWASTSHALQKLRDNPECADSELANISEDTNPGLSYVLTFKPTESIMSYMTSLLSFTSIAAKPKVAILRDQGINGQAEMAYAFHAAGFLAVDVHMTDIIAERVNLADFIGLAACGGFSYGDVLGAGQGWAKSVLLHNDTKKAFYDFFARPNTFTLGVCNGCQFLSKLKSIIPGANDWPSFERNESEQYEARFCMVNITDVPPDSGMKPSVFLHGMSGTSMPIAVAHGEGRTTFRVASNSAVDFGRKHLAPFRYVDNRTLQPTMQYPYNPNGSPEGIAGVRSEDGRVLALMPHPERTILQGIGSYIPDGKAAEWGEHGPWHRLFTSARKWVG